MSDETEVEAPASEPVVQGRVELPRTHWIEVRDAWDITERERNALMAEVAAKQNANRPARRANAGLAGTAPQAAKAADDEEDVAALVKQRAAAGHALLGRFIVAWGGPQLDGKPVTQEVLDSLPVPLFNAIDDAITPQLNEVFPGTRRRDNSPNS